MRLDVRRRNRKCKSLLCEYEARVTFDLLINLLAIRESMLVAVRSLKASSGCQSDPSISRSHGTQPCTSQIDGPHARYARSLKALGSDDRHQN